MDPLTKALKQFLEQQPNASSADLMIFMAGWRACLDHLEPSVSNEFVKEGIMQA